MMTIDDIHMPLEVERGMTGGPAFFTTMLVTPNGVKTPVMAREQALHQWDLAIVGMHDANILAMQTFFYGRRGPAYGFLFKDWSDYKMPVQVIGEGDGVETDFALIKVYADAIRPYNRFITRPVIATIKVYVDGVEKTYTTHYTFEAGYIVFLAAPADDTEITAECQFDIPVNFMDDKLTMTMLHSTQGLMPTFKIEEINEFAQLS